MAFKIKQPGTGAKSLPTETAATTQKPAVVQSKPVTSSRPSKQTPEVASEQFIFYITPSESKAFKEMLDGRPVSSFIRKKVIQLIGENNGI